MVSYFSIINKTKKTKTQVNYENAVEDKEVNNKNYFFEDGNNSDNDEDNTLYVQRYTILRHLTNNPIANMTGRRVTYEEGEVKLQVEEMSKITMEVEK